MSKHTPAPWLLEQTTVYALNDERTPVNRFTASVDSGWMNNKERIPREEVFANVRLIAKSPELLTALAWALPFVDEAITRDLSDGAVGIGADLAQLRAAQKMLKELVE